MTCVYSGGNLFKSEKDLCTIKLFSLCVCLRVCERVREKIRLIRMNCVCYHTAAVLVYYALFPLFLTVLSFCFCSISLSFSSILFRSYGIQMRLFCVLVFDTYTFFVLKDCKLHLCHMTGAKIHDRQNVQSIP